MRAWVTVFLKGPMLASQNAWQTCLCDRSLHDLHRAWNTAIGARCSLQTRAPACQHTQKARPTIPRWNEGQISSSWTAKQVGQEPESSSTLGRFLCIQCLRSEGTQRVICDNSITCHLRTPGLLRPQRLQLDPGGPYQQHHGCAMAAKLAKREQINISIKLLEIHSNRARSDLSFML